MKSPLALFCFNFFLFTGLWALWSCDNNSTRNAPSNKLPDLVVAEQMKNRSSYDSAILFFRKSSDKSLKSNQHTEWVKGVCGLIDCYKSKGDLDEAIRLVDQALAIATNKVDTTGNIYNTLIQKKASLFSDKRQFEQAETLFKRNIRIYSSRPAAPDTGLALAFNGMGTINLLQYKYNEALDEYNKAIGVYEKTDHRRSVNYTGTLQNIGIVYSMSGNYEKAEQYFLKSLKVNQEVLPADDPKLALLYLNMGRFYQIVRNDSKAIEYMKRAENFYISQNQSNSIQAGILYLNMGVFYIYAADFEKAQSYFDKSLDIILTKAPGNQADLLTLYLNMGFIAEKKGEYASAKNYYLKGLSIGDKFPNSVKILRGLANLSFKMSDILNANVYYKMALQKSIEMYGEEHPETALTYLRYGEFLSMTGDKQALVYLNKSLYLYKKSFGDVNIDVSTAYNFIGSYYNRINDFKKAVSYFQLSLIAGFPSFTSNNISDNPEISSDNLNDNLLKSLTAKANAVLSLYLSDTTRIDLLKDCIASYTLSLKMIEMLRSTYQDENSKLFISENEKTTFTNALLSQVKLYHKTQNPTALDEAFSLSEKGKSAVLLSHLRDKEAKSIGRIPENLLNQDASLKSEIYFYNKQIHDLKLTANPDDAKIKMWNSRIFELSRKQDELIKSIEKNYPAYYNLKYDNSVISINDIQKKLSPKQAIIEFTLTDSTIYTFAITHSNKQLLNTSIDSSFYTNLQTLRAQLTGKDFNNYTSADFKVFVNSSYDLYRKLLSPIQTLIKGKELIIIPDGELGYLSFDILLTSLPGMSKPSYRKLPYLIKESAISYAPSATTFFDELNRKSIKNNGRILAFGPDYGPDNTVLNQKDENGKLLQNTLPNLSNTRDEIKNLKEYFNVKAFLGKDASETAFKKTASDYRVLHLAMHTVINNENPLYSKLIFYKQKGDTIDDGMLNASELVNMELHADMAVLSACNTGSGKMRKGEGIMSLSRDFFYAGVPGIIMTSWAVEDRSGVKLMENFYKYISQGKPRHEALRLAKIEYLENCDKLTSHPHYWAAYMNVGDISPLEGFGKKTTSFSIYGAAATLFCIALLLLVYLIRKQKIRKPDSDI
jgi:CHAT domain-containing protein/tetratricopeptide (TPR) repeat protein